MKKTITLLAFILVGSFAHAEAPAMSLVRCVEHNAELDINIPYVIHSDLNLSSGKGIIYSEIDGISIVYPVAVSGSYNDDSMEISTISNVTELVTETIEVNLQSDTGTGVRKVTTKKSNMGASSEQSESTVVYPMQCERLL